MFTIVDDTIYYMDFKVAKIVGGISSVRDTVEKELRGHTAVSKVRDLERNVRELNEEVESLCGLLEDAGIDSL